MCQIVGSVDTPDQLVFTKKNGVFALFGFIENGDCFGESCQENILFQY